AVLLAGEKDRGFERYLKGAREVIGPAEVVERHRGWRVALAERSDSPAPPPPAPATFGLELRGRALDFEALPGVFSSGKLDRATGLLLSALPPGAGRRVLDIGCGGGPLAVALAAEGAAVTALDDDLNAVAATRASLARNGLAGSVRHSDVDGALEPDERFDLIVANPPFHVGSRVVLDVPAEFVKAAGRRLAPGGEFWLVANDFLPYEPLLRAIGPVGTAARSGGFKVLLAAAR
ncbi:MAG TPA: methyltransferase, partial [Deinococcales bacterium]|nr:methyltransferase [Deinococcales bacterium]